MHKRIAFFIHPIPLLAVATMALNDHWLKQTFPSWVTGKLSDFCGIFYLPIFILALLTLLRARGPSGDHERDIPLTLVDTIGAIAFTDGLMLIVKLSPLASRAIERFFAQYLFRIALTPDPTDLIALVMNIFTFWYLKKYIASPTSADYNEPGC
jgi:hypothetical protein